MEMKSERIFGTAIRLAGQDQNPVDGPETHRGMQPGSADGDSIIDTLRNQRLGGMVLGATRSKTRTGRVKSPGG